MRLLVVDDEERIINIIKEYCEDAGYIVDSSNDGIDAIDKLNNNKYDILILDIMMPKMDGFTLLEKIPKEKRIPTIVLSARSEEEDKLLGFDLGIDDYLTKPFSPKELMARIKALDNRINPRKKDIYVLDKLEVNKDAHTIKIDKRIINVTPKEFEILTYLIDHMGSAISREELYSKLWGYDFIGEDRTLDTHIKLLRANLGEYRKYLKTVRGIGYKFDEEE